MQFAMNMHCILEARGTLKGAKFGAGPVTAYRLISPFRLHCLTTELSFSGVLFCADGSLAVYAPYI